MAYAGAAAYGSGWGGAARRGGKGAVVDDARLKRALSQRFACFNSILRGAGELGEEGTENPSGVFQVASFNSGSIYTVRFEVANGGRGGTERKCVGKCSCPDKRKQGSRYACKHQASSAGWDRWLGVSLFQCCLSWAHMYILLTFPFSTSISHQHHSSSWRCVCSA